MRLKSATWIASIAQWLMAAIGVWVILASDALGYGDANLRVETVERIIGPLIASVGVIAAWEATRSVRWLNAVLGLALAVLPAMLGSPTSAIINDGVCGVVTIALVFVPYPTTHSFGGGWRSVFSSARPTA